MRERIFGFGQYRTVDEGRNEEDVLGAVERDRSLAPARLFAYSRRSRWSMVRTAACTMDHAMNAVPK